MMMYEGNLQQHLRSFKHGSITLYSHGLSGCTSWDGHSPEVKRKLLDFVKRTEEQDGDVLSKR